MAVVRRRVADDPGAGPAGFAEIIALDEDELVLGGVIGFIHDDRDGGLGAQIVRLCRADTQP